MSNHYDHIVSVDGIHPLNFPTLRDPKTGMNSIGAPIWWWLDSEVTSRISYGQQEILRELQRIPKGALPECPIVPKWEPTKGAKLLGGALPGRLKPSHVEALSMEIRLQGDGRSAPWQGLRAYYHRSWSAFFRGGKRVHMSLEGFIKKRLVREMSQAEVDRALKTIYDWLEPSAKAIEGLKFFTKNGGHENSAEVFTRVYTNVQETHGSDYPSVAGSCVRYTAERWGLPRGIEHPVTCYATPDISLAWLEDQEGYTVARTLVNHATGAIQRIYRAAPEMGDTTLEREVASARSKLLTQKIREIWPESAGYGLAGCHLMAQTYNEGWVVPYLDQDLEFTPTGKVGGDGREELRVEIRGEFPAQNTEQAWLQGGTGLECYHCSETISEDDCFRTPGEGFHCCEYCWDYHYFNCHKCGEGLDRESEVTVDGGDYWCPGCADSCANLCDQCQEYTTMDMTEVDGDYWCPDCCSCIGISFCEQCQEHTAMEMTEVDRDLWCPCCAGKYATPCERCEEHTAMDTTYVDGDYWCPDCVDRYAYECPNCDTFTREPYDDEGYCCEGCQPNEEKPEEQHCDEA